MSRTVQIYNGIYRHNIVNGIFKVHTNYRKAWEGAGRPADKDGKLVVLDPAGNQFGVWVNESDFEYLADGVRPKNQEIIQPSNDELYELVKSRFETFHELSVGVTEGHIRSLIVSGAPGIGKTHELEAILKEAQQDEKISGYESFSGSAGAPGLYEVLYNYSNEDDVVLLDDMDCLFYDKDAINVLKKALDSSPVRKVSWLKQNKDLKSKDIPNSFEYRGSVVFITNEDFHARLLKQDALHEHIKAFMSRSSYLDLCIHSVAAILMRIKYVMYETPMLDDRNISTNQKDDIMNFLITNQNDFLRIDLRSCIKIAGYMNMNPNRWQTIAQHCLFKPNRSI